MLGEMDTHGLPAIDPVKGAWEESALGRRGFLQASFWALTLAAGLTVGGIAARFLVADTFRSRQQNWVELGKLGELPPAVMHRLPYRLQIRDVWRTIEQGGLVYAYSADGQNYTVLDAACTHLSCNVKWAAADGQFLCPCHGGVFSQQGDVLAGPPPKALRRLETKVENGLLYALI